MENKASLNDSSTVTILENTPRNYLTTLIKTIVVLLLLSSYIGVWSYQFWISTKSNQPNSGSLLKNDTQIVDGSLEIDIEKGFYRIDDYSVYIIWDYEKSGSVKPFEEYTAERIQFTPVKPAEIERSVYLVKEFLKSYEPEFIQKEIFTIFLLDSLTLDGVDAGGTSQYSSLFIVNKGSAQNYTNTFIIETLHHELAHTLYSRYYDMFPTDEWRNANFPEFTYGEWGGDAIKAGNASNEMDVEFFRQGFLNSYSVSAIEEDIAEMYSLLMTNPSYVNYLTVYYPRLGEKFDLLKGFLVEVDWSYTELY